MGSDKRASARRPSFEYLMGMSARRAAKGSPPISDARGTCPHESARSSDGFSMERKHWIDGWLDEDWRQKEPASLRRHPGPGASRTDFNGNGE